MKRLLYILPALALMVLSCTPEPRADYLISQRNPYVGENVRFTSVSEHSNSVSWLMGDGFTYNAFVVDHYYSDPGYFYGELTAFGSSGGWDKAPFTIDVIGSMVTIEVRDYETDVLIPDVEINLFNTLEDWDTGDLNLAPHGPFYTDRYGETSIYDLSYQRYYVDAYFRQGNYGYHNWFLGAEDVVWIETQLLYGPDVNRFIAYVDAVEFLDKKAAAEGRRSDKGSLKDGSAAKGATERELKENKFKEGSRRK